MDELKRKIAVIEEDIAIIKELLLEINKFQIDVEESVNRRMLSLTTAVKETFIEFSAQIDDQLNSIKQK
ncbi:MAG: hypothetical protein LBN05_05105 [Oscillospiraceae bacterium]|jgi:hypothetical protein|nr:hypothetical protein [Oscillospiraceae bacterium]